MTYKKRIQTAIKRWILLVNNQILKLLIVKIALDTEDSNVSDFITHQIEKYLEAAKDFFKKSKNLIRLKTLMKQKRLPDMFKKQLLNSFIAKSFTMSNQKIPLFLIANQIPEEENNEVFKKFRTPESFLRQNSVN